MSIPDILVAHQIARCCFRQALSDRCRQLLVRQDFPRFDGTKHLGKPGTSSKEVRLLVIFPGLDAVNELRAREGDSHWDGGLNTTIDKPFQLDGVSSFPSSCRGHEQDGSRLRFIHTTILNDFVQPHLVCVPPLLIHQVESLSEWDVLETQVPHDLIFFRNAINPDGTRMVIIVRLCELTFLSAKRRTAAMKNGGTIQQSPISPISRAIPQPCSI